MNQKITLSELNELIKDALLDAFPSSVWVVAEISELKENRNGHCYLELVEKKEDEIIARSRATIWSYTYRMLKPYFETTTGQLFTQGIKIMVQVSVEFHSAFGLSLNIRDIDPVYTVGDMALQRKEIVSRLQAEGVFDMNRELELPLVPQKIAVISSATAAGYQDFMNQLESNEFGFRFYVKLFQATMQGLETVPSVIRALEKVYQYEDFFDAVVIIRGGGATADLSSFDNYELAFHITQFPLPVITGIGHEKDDTIIDLVAHTRLKTPTAVAEFLINGMERFYGRLTEMEHEIVTLAQNVIDTQQKKLERIAGNLNYSVSQFIHDKNRQLTKTGNEIRQNVKSFSYKKSYEFIQLKHDLSSVVTLKFTETKNELGQKQRIFKRVVGEVLLKEKAALAQVKNVVTSNAKQMLFREFEKIRYSRNAVRLLNPENVLKRGYTLTLKDGVIIKSVDKIDVKDEIETRFSDGKIKSKITKKDRNDN
ncbi:MAG: exodeoxyribonuclease VII large subunit [Draconibacterium sp.]